ncbi:hypothetical protein VNO77_06318 [Canavalia gladiata]|uniref:Uncharacterized protein n=1 Tax=Canavalia gladiata TaxID=3824 RepID=A0AAN9MC78_CANGL
MGFENHLQRFVRLPWTVFHSYITPAHAVPHLRSYRSLTGVVACLINCEVFLAVWLFSEACVKHWQASLELWI